MVTNYRRGYNFELKVRNTFRDFGLRAERQPGSKPFDILVFRGGEAKFVIDAKKTLKDELYLSKKDLAALIEYAGSWNAYPLIVYSLLNSPAYVAFPKDIVNQGEGQSVKLVAGMELKDFLASYVK